MYYFLSKNYEKKCRKYSWVCLAVLGGALYGIFVPQTRRLYISVKISSEK